MDTAWIQVFVLTLSECVAPAGKTICQERDIQMQFLDRASCEVALERMLWLAEGTSDVIVNRAKSGCSASAVEQTVYESMDDIKGTVVADTEWTAAPTQAQQAPDYSQKAHNERLAVLQTCDDTGGRAPCKIGEIIIEGATEQNGEVWRRTP